MLSVSKIVIDSLRAKPRKWSHRNSPPKASPASLFAENSGAAQGGVAVIIGERCLGGTVLRASAVRGCGCAYFVGAFRGGVVMVNWWALFAGGW